MYRPAMRTAVRASALVNLLVGTRSMTSCSASCTTNDSAGTRGFPRWARARFSISALASNRCFFLYVAHLRASAAIGAPVQPPGRIIRGRF